MFSPSPNFGFIYVLKRFATALVASMCLHFGFSPYLGGFLFAFSTQDLWVQLVLKPMQVGSVMVIAIALVYILHPCMVASEAGHVSVGACALQAFCLHRRFLVYIVFLVISQIVISRFLLQPWMLPWFNDARD